MLTINNELLMCVTASMYGGPQVQIILRYPYKMKINFPLRK